MSLHISRYVLYRFHAYVIGQLLSICGQRFKVRFLFNVCFVVQYVLKYNKDRKTFVCIFGRVRVCTYIDLCCNWLWMLLVSCLPDCLIRLSSDWIYIEFILSLHWIYIDYILNLYWVYIEFILSLDWF